MGTKYTSSKFFYIRSDYFNLPEIQSMTVFEAWIFFNLISESRNQGNQIGIGRGSASDIAHRTVRRESGWIPENDKYLRSNGLLMSEPDFKKGSATSVQNILEKLESDGMIIFDRQKSLYLVRNIGNFVGSVGGGDVLLFARHILNEIKDKRSPKIWHHFILDNKDWLFEINSELTSHKKNKDQISLENILKFEDHNFVKSFFQDRSVQLNLLD